MQVWDLVGGGCCSDGPGVAFEAFDGEAIEKQDPGVAHRGRERRAWGLRVIYIGVESGVHWG